MKRALFFTLGWFMASLALYVSLLLLDVYWNLVSWHPRLDWTVLTLMAWTFAATLSLGLLARFTRDKASQVISVSICVLLLSLGAYAFPPEPLSAGLFGRVASSPLWYRGGRLLVMGLPLVLWAWAKRPAVR
jgi:hypothetical protein